MAGGPHVIIFIIQRVAAYKHCSNPRDPSIWPVISIIGGQIQSIHSHLAGYFRNSRPNLFAITALPADPSGPPRWGSRLEPPVTIRAGVAWPHFAAPTSKSVPTPQRSAPAPGAAYPLLTRTSHPSLFRRSIGPARRQGPGHHRDAAHL
jgi:hypothetical protein